MGASSSALPGSSPDRLRLVRQVARRRPPLHAAPDPGEPDRRIR